MNNPIPFNPDLMTVKQLKECADTLRLVFECIDREAPLETILYYLNTVKESMSKEWNKS